VSDPAIRLSAVSKAYGAGPQASQALANLDLEVRRGAFVSLMGPSGSGKTTLLNLIAGLDMPDTGEVVVEGIRLAGLADHKLADLRLEKIGFIFQAFNLIPALTVEENVGLFLEFAGRSKAEVRRMTAEALQQVGVSGRERRYPGELSGGEQQRVAIARAIVGNASVILADEPTAALDSENGNAVMKLLAEVAKDQSRGVLVVTHDPRILPFADRVVRIEDGKIVGEECRDAKCAQEEGSCVIQEPVEKHDDSEK
jgi:putative ABC transport system ATP-binding protein